METEQGLQIMGSMLMPIIIAIMLMRKRSALVELQRRGLWDQVHGAAKPSRRLCILGGILLSLGMVVVHAFLLAVNLMPQK